MAHAGTQAYDPYRSFGGQTTPIHAEQLAEYYRTYYEKAAIEQLEHRLEIQRLELEAEMQRKLDQVGAEVELIETINARTRRRLKRRVVYITLLSMAAAGAVGWFFVKRLHPELRQLRMTVAQVYDEKGRLEQRLRDNEESLRRANERLSVVQAEFDKAKNPAPPTAVQPSSTNAAALGAATKGPAAAPPPPKQPAPSHTAAAVRPAKPAKCKCQPSDPMCGCL